MAIKRPASSKVRSQEPPQNLLCLFHPIALFFSFSYIFLCPSTKPPSLSILTGALWPYVYISPRWPRVQVFTMSVTMTCESLRSCQIYGNLKFTWMIKWLHFILPSWHQCLRIESGITLCLKRKLTVLATGNASVPPQGDQQGEVNETEQFSY